MVAIERERESKKPYLSLIASLVLITTTANTADTSTITTDPTGVNLNKTDSDTAQNIRIQPTKDGMKSSFSLSDKRNYQIDIGTSYESNKAKNDILLDASYRMLYDGAKSGTYIGIAKGSELEKFVISQGFALKNGRIKLSAALLRRLTLLDFSEYSQSFKERLTQKSFGAEYSHGFERDSLFQEIKSSITYYDLEGKELGRIGDIIVNTATLYDWTRVYGGYRGGTKIVADATAVLKLSDTLKASLSLGYDRLTYKAMYDQNEETSTKLASAVSLAYRLNDYHQLDGYAKSQNSQKVVGAKYSHDFGNAFSGYLSAEKLHRDYAPSDTQYRFGVSYSFGADEKHTRLSPLFASYNAKSSLMLSDLSPISAVNSDNFAISPKKVIYNEHIARVDKTALAAGDGITVASDGTLSNIYFDNGGFTVLSIDAANDSSYLPYLGIVGGKLAVINLTALNSHMASQGLTTGQTKLLNVSVSDTSGGGISLYAITITKGSVEIMASVQKAYSVSAAQKAAFLAGTKSIAQVNAENAAGDTTPDAFSFVDQTNLHLYTLTESAAITISGITASTAISVSGGEYQIGGGAWTSAAGTVTNAQSVKVRNTTGSLGNTAVNTTLTIGGVSDTFTTTTTNTIYKVGNIVTDPSTGLRWQDDAAAGTHTETWANASTYCSALTVDGVSGWRLPTHTELQGIVDTGNLPAIKSGFANTASNYYWSSTEFDADLARVVDFYDGASGWSAKGLSYYVRCVR